MAINGFWTRAKIIWSIVIVLLLAGLGTVGYLYSTGQLKFFASSLGFIKNGDFESKAWFSRKPNDWNVNISGADNGLYQYANHTLNGTWGMSLRSNSMRTSGTFSLSRTKQYRLEGWCKTSSITNDRQIGSTWVNEQYGSGSGTSLLFYSYKAQPSSGISSFQCGPTWGKFSTVFTPSASSAYYYLELKAYDTIFFDDVIVY